MTLKQIYQKAAEMVDNGGVYFSCTAISRALGKTWDLDLHDPVVVLYARIFNPEQVQFIALEEQKQVRVLMLCLMAECWRDFV